MTTNGHESPLLPKDEKLDVNASVPSFIPPDTPKQNSSIEHSSQVGCEIVALSAFYQIGRRSSSSLHPPRYPIYASSWWIMIK